MPKFFENPRVLIICDILAIAACVSMLIDDVIAAIQDKTQWNIHHPLDDVTDVTDVAGNKDA